MAAATPSEAPETSPVVIVVVDDISVRESLEALINFEGWRVETYASGEEFLARTRKYEPCCLILDVSLPDLNGLDLQQLLTDRREMPIIFITGHGDIPMTVRAMKAGAIEFLTKPIDDKELLNAIRSALERSHTELDNEAELDELRGRWNSLTPREQEVITLVVSGLLNKQVGYKLNISEITVKAHRGKAMTKMRADSLADMVRMATRLGIAPSKNPWQIAAGSEEPR